MERYNQIIGNKTFCSYLERMEKLEQNREFCRHGLTHLLDVCRVAYIFALEEDAVAVAGGKDVIYAAGLTHDLGRVKQYEDGTPHDEASVQIARVILADCGYQDEEIKMVCQAIAGHRGSKHGEGGMDGSGEACGAQHGEKCLASYIYRADKAVRNCFCCEAANECNWDETRKNKGIV